MDIEIFSFFSGLGILDLGFEKAGFKMSFVNEFNKDFLKAYKYTRKNSDSPKYGYSNNDIRDLLDNKLWNEIFPKYDKEDNLIGFIGGPPCPDFSIGGKNKGHSGKNGVLTEVYVDLIIKRKPDFFVLENVKGLYRTKKHRLFYDEQKEKMSKAGYFLTDSIENALEYGVPQSRERLILVGFNKKTLKNYSDFKIGQHKLLSLKDIKSKPWPKEEEFKEGSVRKSPDGIIKGLSVEDWFKKNKVNSHPNAQDCFRVKSSERFYTIKEGDVSSKSFKRLHRWRYAPTSAYGNNEVHLHPYHARRINAAEAMAIQSLPKDFVLPSDITLSSKFKMIGNGVPFLLAKSIASDIYCFLTKNLKR